MAGPTASVLFDRTESEAVPLVRRARLACGSDGGDNQEFWLDGRPFVATNGFVDPRMLAELVKSGLPSLLGWTPKGVVVVAAMCNGAEDHRLLAQLCLAICEETGGIVGFGGALPFGADLDGRGPARSSRVENPAGLQGVLFSTSYETAGGSFATTHYAGAKLLRAWLEHPTFHMIK
jgi:hypothetical protein